MSHLLATWATLGGLFACLLGVGLAAVLANDTIERIAERRRTRARWTVTVSERVRS